MKKFKYDNMTLASLQTLFDEGDYEFEGYAENLEYSNHSDIKKLDLIAKCSDHILTQKKHILRHISINLLQDAITHHIAEDLCQLELEYRIKKNLP